MRSAWTCTKSAYFSLFRQLNKHSALFSLSYLNGCFVSTHATFSATPFIVRIIENALKEVSKGVIEAALSFGASHWQIVLHVMFVEALPRIVSGITLALILVVGFSAMAGAIGGGGLGDIAIKYGYYRFQSDVMLYTVIILIILVQLIQNFGDFLYKKLKH